MNQWNDVSFEGTYWLLPRVIFLKPIICPERRMQPQDQRQAEGLYSSLYCTKHFSEKCWIISPWLRQCWKTSSNTHCSSHFQAFVLAWSRKRPGFAPFAFVSLLEMNSLRVRTSKICFGVLVHSFLPISFFSILCFFSTANPSLTVG